MFSDKKYTFSKKIVKRALHYIMGIPSEGLNTKGNESFCIYDVNVNMP
jgi:hypothetical protein